MRQALNGMGGAQLSSDVTAASSSKKTSNADFAEQLQRVMQSGSNTLLHAANKTAPFVPGSAIVSTAVSEAASAVQNNPGIGGMPMLGGMSGGGGGLLGGGNRSFSGGNAGGFNGEMGGLERDTISANVALLQMQQRFQMLGVQFTGISNAMKADHDAKKNSISNIR